MGRNLELLPARLADDIGVHTDEVVLHLGEHCAGALVGASRDLGLPGPADPPNRVFVGAAAARALRAVPPVPRRLGKELWLVHRSSATGSVDILRRPDASAARARAG